VRLRYTGIGNAVILDAGTLPLDLVYFLNFQGFIVEAPASAGHGVYIRSVHHSQISVRVDGCGASKAAFQVEFAVCTVFHSPESSNNSSNGFYLGAKPLYGMYLTERLSGEQVAYCTILNPVMEGVDTGVRMERALGTKLIGGTLEGCTAVGLSLGAGALRNIIDHVDFEVNVSADISSGGDENTFIDIDSDSLVYLGDGNLNHIRGGNFKTIVIDTGCNGTLLDGVRYNRANDGGVLTDNGLRTRMSNVMSSPTVSYQNSAPQTVGITVGASPFTYVNSSGANREIYVIGGTVSMISKKRGTGTATTVGVTAGMVDLSPDDSIIVTYSAAPTMHYMTK